MAIPGLTALGRRLRRLTPSRTPAPANKGATARRPDLSIVIPAYNEAAFIATTLEAVLETTQRYSGQAEVIVVDNNSTDETGEIAQSFKVRVVFESLNQIARARNAGAQAARGEVLIFLDADTLIFGDILERVAELHASGTVIGGGAWVEPDTGLLGRLIFKYLVNYPLALRNLTPGPFLFCDRLAFEQVGGFDQELYAAEEFSLAKRLQAVGQRLGKDWRIIKYSRGHRLVTSGRKFKRFGGVEMAVQNAHLLWHPHQKIRDKSQCRFWYDR